MMMMMMMMIVMMMMMQVEYSRERVEMLVEKRRRAVDREYREKMERQELGASIEVMLGETIDHDGNDDDDIVDRHHEQLH